MDKYVKFFAVVALLMLTISFQSCSDDGPGKEDEHATYTIDLKIDVPHAYSADQLDVIGNKDYLVGKWGSTKLPWINHRHE